MASSVSGLRIVPLSGSRTTSVAWPASINCQVLPVSSLRQMPPLRTAQGGVDDHLAGRRQLGIDDDLVDRRADEVAVASWPSRSAGSCRWNRRCPCCRSRFQVAPPSMEIRKPTPGVPVSPSPPVVLRSGDDDRLVGVVVPGEDGDAADVDARARAEVGQRDDRSGRWGSVVRKLVVFQMPPLAPAT